MPAAPALSPAAEAVRTSLLALPAAERTAVLASVPPPGDAAGAALGDGPFADDGTPLWPDPASPLGRRQKAELDRRLAALASGEAPLIPGEEAMSRLRETIRWWEREAED